MGQNTIRVFLATGKEQAASSKMWSHLIKGTSALPVVLSEDIVRLDLIMMFMEIISVKIIIGHREQRDGDINLHWWPMNWFLISACKWMVRVIHCIGILDTKHIFHIFGSSGKLTHYSMLFCFIRFFFFIKCLECREEASSKAHP